jgi:hypothetical protein
MGRLRIIAALLSCFAVLVAGLANVAAARDFGQVAAERSAAAAPCEHCDDCDKAPCPMPMADCLQVHASGTAAMLVASIEFLPGPIAVEQHAAAAHTLSGLSPPPDPFPPRT